MWYLHPMMKLKQISLLLLIGATGCSTGGYTPGATLLSGLKQYQGEMQSTGNSPSRWPDRQRAGGTLKTTIAATVGSSAEFYRLIDLDVRKREFMITMRETSLRADRLQEMKEELAKMDEEIGALTPIIRSRLTALPVQGDGQPRVEGIATVGLLGLAVDAFSSPGSARGLEAPSTKIDRYVVTDLGAFSTVRSPDGQTFRCAVFGVAEEGAGIKCEPVTR